jgi:two-component system response regulator (stage 0 sporulation protein F)
VSPSRILIVDDDEGIRVMLADLFGDEGYAVSTAGNGRQALDQVKTRAFDVVLLDMAMPVMDGWQFTRALQEHQIQVPVVAMTAARSATALAKEVVAAAYLTKPFDIETVLSTVATIVGDDASGCR